MATQRRCAAWGSSCWTRKPSSAALTVRPTASASSSERIEPSRWPAADELDHVLALAALHAARDVLEVAAARRGFEVQRGEQAVERRARAVQARAGVDEREQARAAVAGRAGLHHARGVAADRLLVDLLDEAVLRAEVVVQRALRDADVGGDRVEARARAVLGEALDGVSRSVVAQATYLLEGISSTETVWRAVVLGREQLRSPLACPSSCAVCPCSSPLLAAALLAPAGSAVAIARPGARASRRPRDLLDPASRETRVRRHRVVRRALAAARHVLARRRARGELAGQAEVRRDRSVRVRLVALPAGARRGQGARLERAAHAQRAGAALGDQRRARPR